jgi:pheromone shutdown-related protein TraB
MDNSENAIRHTLGDREIIILGTAHVSRESVREVEEMIEREKPDRVCIEIDESRYRALSQGHRWKNLKITRILREKKGFLLLSNLILAAFQRRLGLDLGIKPGAEMVAAIDAAKRENIPFSLCDREIQITLKRAWVKSGFWGKNKMLAVMLSSLFSGEKLSAEDIEEMRKKSTLQNMLEELAAFLPRVKEVLIDERDRYLASEIYTSTGKKTAVVVGAGHVPGILSWLDRLQRREVTPDVDELNQVPPKKLPAKILPWAVPIIIVGAIAAGFIIRGSETTLNLTYKWIIINGALAAIGAIAALAHPLTILLAFVAAPFTSLIPVIGVGIPTGILEGTLRKPRVGDLESLPDDIATFKGFFKNRFTHVLIVFVLTSIGSVFGTFIGGIPLVASLFK